MSPVNSMFVCIKKKKKSKKKKQKKKKLSANLFLKWPISIIGKMLNIGADNRSTPSSTHDTNAHFCMTIRCNTFAFCKNFITKLTFKNYLNG